MQKAEQGPPQPTKVHSLSVKKPCGRPSKAMASMEALTIVEIKRTLRGCSIPPQEILAARTKVELIELAQRHGIKGVPDEWTIEKIKASKVGAPSNRETSSRSAGGRKQGQRPPSSQRARTPGEGGASSQQQRSPYEQTAVTKKAPAQRSISEAAPAPQKAPPKRSLTPRKKKHRKPADDVKLPLWQKEAALAAKMEAQLSLLEEAALASQRGTESPLKAKREERRQKMAKQQEWEDSERRRGDEAAALFAKRRSDAAEALAIAQQAEAAEAAAAEAEAETASKAMALERAKEEAIARARDHQQQQQEQNNDGAAATGAVDVTDSSVAAAPTPLRIFEPGTQVFIPRSRGGESKAFVLEYDAERAIYTVELDERNSGNYKLATADFLSTEPRQPQDS
jgi:hypothetical protein